MATANGALVTSALEAPEFTLICWPTDSDEEGEGEDDDNNDDVSKEDDAEGDAEMKRIGEAQSNDSNDEWEDADDIGPEITDKGYSITKDSRERFIYIVKEVDKRDQDTHGMHIMNDWSGYGFTELLENMEIKDLRNDYKEEDYDTEIDWDVEVNLYLP